MKLEHEFIQLPYAFNVERLQHEVNGLAKALWTPHHEGFKGNYSIPLVSRGGKMNNDFKGAMACTDVLDQCPYLRQVIASFGEIVGRSRLMGLDAGCEVPLHSDINYHWYKRVRIHVPIVTDPDVLFICGDKQIHMQAGEAWIFDSWKYHQVKNDSDIFRIHLVVDICGSADFWQMAEKARVPWLENRQQLGSVEYVNFEADRTVQIKTEQFNTPLVMSPGEMEGLADDLISDLRLTKENSSADVQEMITKVNAFCQQWRCLWNLYGFNEAGWPHYHQLRKRAFEGVQHLDNRLHLLNGTQAPRMFLHCMIDPALNPEVKDSFLVAPVGSNTTLEKSGNKPVVGAHNKQRTGSDTPMGLSRNDPCHCGSGRKFKHCHGKLN